MMNMKKYIIISFILLFALISCQVPHTDNTTSLAEEKPEKLIVYLTGNAMQSAENDTSQSISYYFSTYTLGPANPLFIQYGQEGFLLSDALQAFESESGITLDLRFFMTKGDMEKQMQIDIEQGEAPDLILLDHMTYAGEKGSDSLYRLMAEDWFYDVTDFMQAEGLYSNGNYYTPVLRAGIFKERQLLLPILFNVSTLMAGQETMAQTGFYLQPDMATEEWIQGLESVMHATPEGIEGLDFLGAHLDLFQIIPALFQAAGVKPVEEETGRITLEKDIFERIAGFYADYLRMQYRGESEIDFSFSAKQQLDERKQEYMRSRRMDILQQYRPIASARNDIIDVSEFEPWSKQGYYYLEGGNTYQLHFHSFITQAMFMDSLFQARQEELKVVGVSNTEGFYTALISLCGGVYKESQHPEYAYQLLCYLMDQTYFPYCGVSVNREVTEDMLDTLATWEFQLDPYYAVFEGYEKQAEHTFTIASLRPEIRDQLEAVLEHVGTALLPCYAEYEPIMHAIESYAWGILTLEDAYRQALQELEALA